MSLGECMTGGTKRGAKPNGKVKIEWSSDFAYAIGLIASDGCVSKDGRHVLFVSKEIEQVNNYMKALGIVNAVDITRSGQNIEAFRVQFSDVIFWRYLNSIGIHPAKSKTMQDISVPPSCFFDFVRGMFDGDGCVYSYWDKRWRSSFMFYVSFATSSPVFVHWMQGIVLSLAGIRGRIYRSEKKECFQLRYAKAEARILISKMYEKEGNIHLRRKRLKIDAILGTIASTGSAQKLKA